MKIYDTPSRVRKLLLSNHWPCDAAIGAVYAGTQLRLTVICPDDPNGEQATQAIAHVYALEFPASPKQTT
jgi:hypothetical protein